MYIYTYSGPCITYDWRVFPSSDSMNAVDCLARRASLIHTYGLPSHTDVLTAAVSTSTCYENRNEKKEKENRKNSNNDKIKEEKNLFPPAIIPAKSLSSPFIPVSDHMKKSLCVSLRGLVRRVRPPFLLATTLHAIVILQR
jgi:hypothetical protein